MKDLRSQLAALEALPPAQLRAEWERLHGQAAPKLTPALLRLDVAYALQAKATGKRAKTGLVPRLQSTRPASAIAPGTQLVRSWNGRTISVVAEEQGFLFEGKHHLSLTAIARIVTGAHWSGPRFFGLTASSTSRG